MKKISGSDYRHLKDAVEVELTRDQIDWYIKCMHICATEEYGPEAQTWSLGDESAYGEWIALMNDGMTPKEAVLSKFGWRH